MITIKELKTVFWHFIFIFFIVHRVVIASEQGINRLVPGDYLSEEYIKKVTTSQSTKLKFFDSYPQEISVTKSNGTIHFTPIFNFHEAGVSFSAKSEGGVIIERESGSDISHWRVVAHSNRSFSIIFGQQKTIKYEFVGNSYNYIANIILVGKYRDNMANQYFFKNNGQAFFPDTKFRYRIGLDHVEQQENQFDYYFNESNKAIYGFKRSNGRLEIYKTMGEMSEKIEDKPFLILYQWDRK